MITCRFTISVLLLCFFFMPVPSAAGQETTGPRVLPKEMEFDFGEVREGDVITHTFSVLNTGDGPLEIERVSPG